MSNSTNESYIRARSLMNEFKKRVRDSRPDYCDSNYDIGYLSSFLEMIIAENSDLEQKVADHIDCIGNK
jgi:hypothetical protein